MQQKHLSVQKELYLGMLKKSVFACFYLCAHVYSLCCKNPCYFLFMFKDKNVLFVSQYIENEADFSELNYIGLYAVNPRGFGRHRNPAHQWLISSLTLKTTI